MAGHEIDTTEATALLEDGRVDFPCQNCGADMTWAPAPDALKCDHCGHLVRISRGEETILERPIADAGAAARGLDLELRAAKCGRCGARVAFQERSTAEVCVYCGSPNVLDQEVNRNALRPESLVPLDVSREDVQARYRQWVKRLWFRPNALKKRRKLEGTGVYVPFWTFDCRVHSSWSAVAGYYYYVTETYSVNVGGRRQTRTRQVRKIRWVPAWGERRDAYDDHLVSGSESLPPKLMDKLGGFDTNELVPYRPEYLAGWRAEEYQVDLVDAWKQGEADVVASQRRRCAGDVPGDTHMNLQVRNNIADVRWKHVLLPVWSLQYRYGKKTYTVLVNGQTGRVAGEAPVSWIKILVAAAIVAVVVVLAVLLGGG